MFLHLWDEEKLLGRRLRRRRSVIRSRRRVPPATPVHTQQAANVIHLFSYLNILNEKKGAEKIEKIAAGFQSEVKI